MVPAISTNKASYDPNETIEFEWMFAAGNATDWIGIFEAGAPNDESYEFYWYLDGKKSGSRVVYNPGLGAGSYEARLFFNDGYDLKAATSFEVQ
jgi:hypothetical protein